MILRSSDLTVTDMFCGAGGSSIGACAVDGIRLRMGLNHWERAIETHSVTAGGGHHGLVINGAAIMAMRDSDRPEQLVRELTDALHTQATMPQLALIQRQPYLFRYNGTMNVRGVAGEMFTVDTRDRLGLVQPGEALDVEDCYFRMLKPAEIGRGMAFPDDYEVTGNGREQVKQYGNAVTPPAMRTLVSRVVASLS